MDEFKRFIRLQSLIIPFSKVNVAYMMKGGMVLGVTYYYVFCFMVARIQRTEPWVD